MSNTHIHTLVHIHVHILKAHIKMIKNIKLYLGSRLINTLIVHFLRYPYSILITDR